MKGHELLLPQVGSHPDVANVSLDFGKRRSLGLPPFPDVYQAPPADAFFAVQWMDTQRNAAQGGQQLKEGSQVSETLY